MNDIIEQNRKRYNKLFPYYNPATGEGSPIERFKFILSDEQYILLPKSMLSIEKIVIVHEAGGLHKYKPHNSTTKDFQKEFRSFLYSERFKHDFEFWAFECIKIQDKVTALYVPFTLRAAQRKLLLALETMRLNRIPIRLILLKARQWGGSTLTQIYMMWMQTLHLENWNSVIGTEVISQGENIKAMYEQACDYYPEYVGTLTMKPFGKGNAKQIKERGCKIYLGSMEKPNTLRSGNYAMAHFSEVGVWKETKGKKPEDVISSVSSSILYIPNTMVVEESTAKGEGNYFHRKWLGAVRHDNKFIALFVAWYEIEMYQKPFESDEELIAFWENLNERGKELWAIGASLEGINWYFEKQKSEGFADWQMHEEFPTTAEEAFISSGERVIPISYMLEAVKTIRQPIGMGEIVADSNKGKQALKNVRFEKNDATGRCKIWKFPDLSIRYNNRYLVCMDIGGRSAKADKTVIRVIDRFWRMHGGVDEFVLTWRGNIDADLGVWIAAMIAKWYDDALLVVESNTIDSKHQHTEGDHTYTVFNEIAKFYDNLYVREDPQRVKENLEPKYGFNTNTQTKTTIVDGVIAGYRDNNFIEHDQEMIDESNQYEHKQNGTMGAKEGCHDDVFMSSAIGLHVSDTLPNPTLRDTANTASYVSTAV